MFKTLSLFSILTFSFITHAQVFLPKTPAHEAEEIIQHNSYTLSYNENHEVANWVAYSLRPDHLQDCATRRNNFRIDPLVSTQSSTPEDYRGSGFDRGHLVPAGDMKRSQTDMDETFYFSNMTPQTREFNGGKWAMLENLVRAWVMEADETIIVSGPILKSQLPVIGPSEVSVPHEHFKIVLQSVKGKYKMLAFLMPANPTASDLKAYGVTVDEVEDMTGIDFFSHLPDSVEDKLEAQFDPKNFNFGSRFTYAPCRR